MNAPRVGTELTGMTGMVNNGHLGHLESKDVQDVQNGEKTRPADYGNMYTHFHVSGKVEKSR